MHRIAEFALETIQMLSPTPGENTLRFLIASTVFFVAFGLSGAGFLARFFPRKSRELVFAPVVGLSLVLADVGLSCVISRSFGTELILLSWAAITAISIALLRGHAHQLSFKPHHLVYWIFAIILVSNGLKSAAVPTQFDASSHAYLHLLMEISKTYPSVMAYPGNSTSVAINYGPTSHEFVAFFRPLGWSLVECWVVSMVIGLAFAAGAIRMLLGLCVPAGRAWSGLAWLLAASPTLFWNSWEGNLQELLTLGMMATALVLFVSARSLSRRPLASGIAGLLIGCAFLSYPSTSLDLFPVFAALTVAQVVGIRLIRRTWSSWSAFYLGYLFPIATWWIVTGSNGIETTLHRAWDQAQPVIVPWLFYPYFFGWITFLLAMAAIIAWILRIRLWTNAKERWHFRAWVVPMLLTLLLCIDYWIFLFPLGGQGFALMSGEWDDWNKTYWHFKTFTRHPNVRASGQVTVALLLPLATWFALKWVLARSRSRLWYAAVLSVVIASWGLSFLLVHYNKMFIDPVDLESLQAFRRTTIETKMDREKVLLLNRSWTSSHADNWVGAVAEVRTMFWRNASGHSRINLEGIDPWLIEGIYTDPLNPEIHKAILDSPITHVFASAEVAPQITDRIAGLKFLRVVTERSGPTGKSRVFQVIR